MRTEEQTGSVTKFQTDSQANQHDEPCNTFYPTLMNNIDCHCQHHQHFIIIIIIYLLSLGKFAWPRTHPGTMWALAYTALRLKFMGVLNKTGGRCWHCFEDDE